MSLAGKERNLGSSASPLTGLSPEGVSHLPDELTRQIDQVAGPLRLGQVSAESHASQQGQPEENDMDRVPAPPAGAGQ
jgi:hypothetical protein